MSNPKDNTNEAQHTKGPWRHAGTFGGQEHVTDDSCRITVAQVNGKEGEAQANALLIAAAPDLLAACEAAESFLRGLVPMYMASDDEEVLQAAERLSTAIAAARGAKP